MKTSRKPILKRCLPGCQFVLIISFLTVMASCSADQPRVTLKGQDFTIEVVTRLEDQMLGLMFREKMPVDHGMLFIYQREEPRSFWMKNTRIPLDIMYFDEDFKLVTAHFNVPPCKRDPCPSYPSDTDAQYVLELNGGVAKELGVSKGTKLTVHY